MNATTTYTLVTGASSGIGRGCAQLLSQSGRNLILVARREDRLKKLADELAAHAKVKFAVVDVANPLNIKDFATRFADLLPCIDTIINSAGLAKGLEPIQGGNQEDWEVMFRTNVMGLLNITRLVLPEMIKRKNGHVINIGSVAGRWAYPNGNIYCATKAAVHMITETLRLDLHGTGVRVTEISPGMVETEFSEVRLNDNQKAKDVYAGMTPLKATDIAETVVWCMTRPSRVNVQEVVIFPTAQSSVRDVWRVPTL